MALNQEKYRFQEGKTPLSAAELNGRVLDIDRRIHALEVQKASVEAAITQIQNLGLARINDVIQPVLTAANQILAAATAELAVIQEGWADEKAAIDAQWADIQAEWAAMGARLSTVESGLLEAENLLALFPTIQAGDAGKALAVKQDGSGFELVPFPDPPPAVIQKSFFIKGSLATATSLIKMLAGATGNITEIAAAITSGTSATVAIKNAGQVVATVTAATAGAQVTEPANQAVTWASQITLDITAVSGSPVDLIGYLTITPTE